MKVFKKTHPPNTKRRKGVIARLEAQLKASTKTAKKMELVNLDGSPSNVVATLPLTEADIKRIEKELLILKTRI